MNEADILREAARIAGSKRTERKAAAARENGKKGGRPAGIPMSAEVKERMAMAQKARWDRERQEKIAAGLLSEQPQEKRSPGRPRTRPIPDAETPKRSRGRPKKQKVAESSPEVKSAENGA